MCTAVSYRTKCHYFGRNLDIERGYHEGVVITPRKFPFSFRYAGSLEQHYALIGMATVVNDYPLYFEATNEAGLSMAGLNFPKNAYYPPYVEGKVNVAPFELIPYLLGSCGSVADARETLYRTNVIHCNFSEDLPVSPLHWLISDREESLVLECTKDGMKVYDNPFGVLTNNPTFDYHIMHLNQYMGLSEGLGENLLNPVDLFENLRRAVAEGIGADEAMPLTAGTTSLQPVRHINTSYDWAKDWIIFPEGLDASGVVRHALLQTWTLKPALYD